MLKNAKFVLNARNWLSVATMLVIVSGCKTRGYNLSSATSDKSNSIILVHCMSPQGNGGNWAATLGWIAADYIQLADRAALVSEEKKRPVFIYPRCFSGGSSGSAVTNVVMSLLANNAVLSSGGDANGALREAGFFTAADMREYAKAIRFLGLSLDMTVTESLQFLRDLGKNTGAAALPIPDPKRQANWWGGARASPEGAVLDFSKVVYAASKITRGDLDQDISIVFEPETSKQRIMNSVNERFMRFVSDIRKDRQGKSVFEKLRDFAKENRIETVSDFPTTQLAIGKLNCSVDPRKCGQGRIQAARFLAQNDNDGQDTPELRYAKFYLIEALQAFYAGNFVDGLVARDDLNKTSFNAEFGEAATKPEAASAFAKNLWQPLGTGYFTVTAAALDEQGPLPNGKRKYSDHAPTFEELRFVIFSDQSTAQAIRRSQLYLEQVKVCSDDFADRKNTVCRFVIAEIEHRVHSMLPSVREPGLMAELYAPAYSATAAVADHLGVKRLFNPKKISEGRSLEEAVVDLSQQDPGKSLYLAVAGGWPDRRIGAWMLMYYLDTLLSNDQDFGVKALFARAIGAPATPDLIASVSLFGKPDSVSDVSKIATKHSDPDLLKKFDVNAVSTVFAKGKLTEKSRIEDIGQENRISYLKMMSLFYGFFTGESGRIDRGSIPVQLLETMNNWDLSEIKKLPAFMPMGADGGASRYLLSLSHNTVNEGLLALDQKLPQDNASSALQYCSLATFERDVKQQLLRKTRSGDVTINRIQCVRRMNSRDSGRAFETLTGKSYRQELAALASNATVTFNVLDPRINLGREDARLVVQDSNGNPVVLDSDIIPEMNAEQKSILQIK